MTDITKQQPRCEATETLIYASENIKWYKSFGKELVSFSYS